MNIQPGDFVVCKDWWPREWPKGDYLRIRAGKVRDIITIKEERFDSVIETELVELDDGHVEDIRNCTILIRPFAAEVNT